jgi:hypothetical protein
MKPSTPVSFKQLLTAITVFLSRLKVLPANFNPLGSFGFFSQNFVLFFATIIAFDLLIGGTYAGRWFTYLGFAAYPLLGRLAADKTNKQLFLLPIASLTFFILSNLGVWWYWFPHTIEGLLACYTLALPFFQRTLVGDLIFGYGYLLVKKLATNKEVSSWLQLNILPKR